VSTVFYGIAVIAPLLPRVAAVIDPAGSFVAMSRTAVGYRHLLAVFGFFLVAFLASHLTESLRRVGAQLDATSASLADLERRSEHILRNIASGLVTTDLAGAITYCNSAAERIAHVAATDVIGRGFSEVFRLPASVDPWSRPARLAEAALRAEGGIAGGGEGPLLGMTFSALRDGEGNTTGVICAFQDLTAIRRMEEQVRRSDRLAAVGELAAGMAHEIRNPLASLSGSIAMLREALTIEGTERELMDIVTGEVGRLEALVSDFLGYASPRDIAPRETDLLGILQETATLLQARAGDCRITVTARAAPPRADVDPQLVRQVFLNLGLNAVEAMPQGGALQIVVSGDGPEIAVEFSDTGVGIPREALGKIFTPFFSTKERGTGLGLALVYKIVEAHRGRIDVESEPGRGTTFRVAFPVRQAAQAQVEVHA
jgi:PAS domain S-box-containing protein